LRAGFKKGFSVLVIEMREKMGKGGEMGSRSPPARDKRKNKGKKKKGRAKRFNPPSGSDSCNDRKIRGGGGMEKKRKMGKLYPRDYCSISKSSTAQGRKPALPDLLS